MIHFKIQMIILFNFAFSLQLHDQYYFFCFSQTPPSYGSYEFFGLGATNVGCDGSSCDGTQAAALIDDVLLDSHLPYLGSSRRSRSPFSDSESSQYTTFSDISGSSTLFDTPCIKPRPVGWRGRGGDTAAICRLKSRGVSMMPTKIECNDAGTAGKITIS